MASRTLTDNELTQFKQVFCKIGMVMMLAERGQAQTILQIIPQFSPEDQTDVLCTQAVISGLSRAGHASDIVEIIAALPKLNQKKIFASDDPYIADTLTEYGQGNAVQKIKAGWVSTSPVSAPKSSFHP